MVQVYEVEEEVSRVRSDIAKREKKKLPLLVVGGGQG